jgi:hypothetical protein
MPKASSETTDAPKRAPRKRAVRRIVSKDDAPVRRKTRAVASRAVDAPSTTTRKAPVYLSEPTPKSSSRKFMIAFAAFVLVVGAASWIGFSDAGQIDVTARINTSNQDAADVASMEVGGSGESVTVPVQNTPPAAISGLRPRTDGGGQQPPAPVPPEESALEEGATTTEDGTDTEGAPLGDESSTIEIEESATTDEGTPELTQ